jgi:tetratricopeptide (TPR) repeat protein
LSLLSLIGKGRNHFVMKKIFLLFFISISISAESVRWHSSILKGLELAKAQKTAIVLDLYTDWCGYCKVLEQRIFPTEAVQKQLKKFIPVRLNAEAFPNLVSHYSVTGYPTVLILDQNGVVLDRVTGLPTPEMLAKKLEAMYLVRDHESLLLSKLRKDPESVLWNFELGVYYYNSGDQEKASKFFKTAYTSKQPDTTKKKHDALFNLALSYIDLENYPAALEYWSEYIEKFPGGDIGAGWYYKGLANVQMKNIEQGKKELTTALKFAKDPSEKAKIEGMLKAIEED